MHILDNSLVILELESQTQLLISALARRTLTQCQANQYAKQGSFPSQANQYAAIVEGPLEADEIGAWAIVSLTDQAQRRS